MTLFSAAASHADELPPRPTEERDIPPGYQIKVTGGEAQCFALPEWKQVGHLVVDYRLLLSWAGQAEILYSVAQVERKTAEAVALTEKAVAAAAQDRERRTQEALAEERKKARRMGWLAGVGGLAALILGGVVVGVVAGR